MLPRAALPSQGTTKDLRDSVALLPQAHRRGLIYAFKTENLWSKPNQNQFVVCTFLTINCKAFKKASTVHEENLRKARTIFI